MNVKYRRTLVSLGLGAAVVASSALFAGPAQAATSGLARVYGTDTVVFQALMSKVNKVKVTISGRTVTIDDVTAISAGRGCKRVDSTKVRCTTSAKTKLISVALGDKNDYVRNYTSVPMLAGGGAGNDTLIGGSGADELQGSTGNDKLYGGGGNDLLLGHSGADYISGGAGSDQIAGGAGNDKIYGGNGNDLIQGQTGSDTIDGGTGSDRILGYSGNDKIYGGTGNDLLIGNAGNDMLSGGAGDDDLVGEHYKVVKGKVISNGSANAADKLYGGANVDICLISTKKSKTSGCEYFTAVPESASAASASAASVPSEAALEMPLARAVPVAIG
ncbi:MAG TPA: calcium-binding protein [Actinoplanes sp.]|nr:calcium-binding protein [Actinoplanes sp.]